MLDPANPVMLALLWLTLGGVLTVLAVRTFRRDQREYRRFKCFRTTKRRQKMLRRWLLISFTLFGGMALVTLVASGAFAAPLLTDVQTWPWVAWLLTLFEDHPSVTVGVLIGAAVGIVALTVVGVIAVRDQDDEVMSLGDVQAILPRNRQELVIGGLLSINAGVVEELLFRLALPALLYATTGNAIIAVVVSLLIFGLMHSYQGITGIVVTTIIGAIFMAVYVLTGSILIAIIAHAVLDLRSLMIIPMAVNRVHLIDGRINPLAFTPKPKPAAAPALEPAESDSAETDTVAATETTAPATEPAP
ncbi:CPBP family intramembrane glutamic endopeptidase [Salinibacterium sp. NK8237]|uniref:CPBP family intramembrane glutamic endopeptidase n=1 Tax=Salinibacterium sp. NK8237 TaxID=2792038 RepID=UPI0018CD0B69|nr:type II CAAX endopeptidase family protein [Salinibacterium sp. NK8237]MBH0131165.1 CPBP family intramembrane metalloprotease [Salinibacterium sp. NK8237]